MRRRVLLAVLALGVLGARADFVAFVGPAPDDARLQFCREVDLDAAAWSEVSRTALSMDVVVAAAYQGMITVRRPREGGRRSSRSWPDPHALLRSHAVCLPRSPS